MSKSRPKRKQRPSSHAAHATAPEYTSESLALASANCVEGTLVFASAWEKMGMKAFLVYGPGRAFAAISCWSDTPSCIIPVETTMVGGTATFADAYNSGAATWNSWGVANTRIVVDVAAERAIAEKALGSENVRIAEILTATGRCYTLLGQPTKAVAHLERALNLQKSKKATPVKIAEIEFYLGRALWNTGRDRERAVVLLSHGWDTYQAGGFGSGKIARDVQDWFKTRSGGRAHVAEAERGR